MKNQAVLLPIVAKYFEKDPAAAAHSLETMSEEQAVEVLKTISPSMATETPISKSVAKRRICPFFASNKIWDKIGNVLFHVNTKSHFMGKIAIFGGKLDV